jgi:hypothetical protein
MPDREQSYNGAIIMCDNQRAACNPDDLLENLAAELTNAAYPLALQHGMTVQWIKVELGLWRALAVTVKKWARALPATVSPDDFKAWREGLLVELTESAFYIAVKHGIKGSLLEVELCLYRAFRLVMRRVGGKALRRQMARVRRSLNTASPSASVPRWSPGFASP